MKPTTETALNIEDEVVCREYYGMKIKVFEKGIFYCEITETELNEREIQDCEVQYIILDRNGRVGIVTSSCNEDFIEWVDDKDDERYRIERGDRL